MLGYAIQEVLKFFLHKHPSKVQHSPYPWTKPVYDTNSQNATPKDVSGHISANKLIFIQQMIGLICVILG